MFSRKKNKIPKTETIKDNESAYLKYDAENDEVVPVKKKEKNSVQNPADFHNKSAESEESLEQEPKKKEKIGFGQWIWLIVIIGCLISYIQFSDSLIKENKKILTVSNTTVEKVVNPKEDESIDTNGLSLKGIIDSSKAKEKTEPSKVADKSFDTVADLDKDYQTIVSSVRNNSELYVNNEISNGRYQLNLETAMLNLKHLKRDLYGYSDSFTEAEITPLSDLMNQKTADLEILIQDLKYSSQEHVPESFNSFADLSKSRAKEYKYTFVEELKEHGYKVTIKENKIVYSL